MVLIPNTLELTTLWVTAPLAAEVEAHPELAFETDFGPMPFDAAGNLDQEALFPESVRAAPAGGLGAWTTRRLPTASLSTRCRARSPTRRVRIS